MINLRLLDQPEPRVTVPVCLFCLTAYNQLMILDSGVLSGFSCYPVETIESA